MASTIVPIDVESRFGEEEIIVSKTDARGHITYANDVFLRVSKFAWSDLEGKPHNVIRHPDMPRGVFKLLWDTIGAGSELFAYIKNICADGSYYWVLAHVTPTREAGGRIIGYHSNRRHPHRTAIDAIAPMYAQMLRLESSAGAGPRAAEASAAWLAGELASQQRSYEEFIWSLIHSDIQAA